MAEGDFSQKLWDHKMVFSFFPFSAFITFQLFRARVTRLNSTASMYLPFKYCQKTFFLLVTGSAGEGQTEGRF